MHVTHKSRDTFMDKASELSHPSWLRPRHCRRLWTSSLEQCCHWLRNDVIVTSTNLDMHTLTKQEAPLRHSTGTSSLTQLCPTLQMWRPWHREPDTARPERGGARMSTSSMLDPKLRLVLTTPCYVPPLRLHQNEGRWGLDTKGALQASSEG